MKAFLFTCDLLNVTEIPECSGWAAFRFRPSLPDNSDDLFVCPRLPRSILRETPMSAIFGDGSLVDRERPCWVRRQYVIDEMSDGSGGEVGMGSTDGTVRPVKTTVIRQNATSERLRAPRFYSHAHQPNTIKSIVAQGQQIVGHQR